MFVDYGGANCLFSVFSDRVLGNLTDVSELSNILSIEHF